jgi:hypothetical protein
MKKVKLSLNKKTIADLSLNELKMAAAGRVVCRPITIEFLCTVPCTYDGMYTCICTTPQFTCPDLNQTT